MYNWGMDIKFNTCRQGSNDELSCLTYSVREASKIMGPSESTVRRMVRDDQLHCVRFRGRIRIPKSVVDDFLRGITGKEAA
jgi:excisionase family DNA binding protein